MKSGDKRRVATLRLVLSSLKNEKIQAQRELTDEEVESVLRRAVKQRKDSIEQFDRGGRQDLVQAETEELAIIEEYLPKGLSDAEAEAGGRVQRTSTTPVRRMRRWRQAPRRQRREQRAEVPARR